MNKRRNMISACAGVIFLLGGTARGALIISMPGGHSVPIADTGMRFYSSPVFVAVGLTASSTNPDGSWIGKGVYSFADNGLWDGSFPFVAADFDALTGTEDRFRVMFTFATPVAGVGGFMNYVAFDGSRYSAPTITAWRSDGAMLERYDLHLYAPVITPGGLNEGAFRGISDLTATLRFSIENSGIGLSNLTVIPGGTPVPEPGASALVGLALAAIACTRRFSRHSTIHSTVSGPLRRRYAVYMRSTDRRVGSTVTSSAVKSRSRDPVPPTRLVLRRRSIRSSAFMTGFSTGTRSWLCSVEAAWAKSIRLSTTVTTTRISIASLRSRRFAQTSPASRRSSGASNRRSTSVSRSGTRTWFGFPS